MNYLLDTCVISELVKKKPDKTVIGWLENCAEEFLFLSVLTIGEIQKGITKLQDSKRKTLIQKWLDKDLLDRFYDRVLPLTTEIASTWGQILGESEIRGKPIPTIDGLLAATAVTHNLTIVTRNEKDIRGTGAKIINPWKL